MSSNLIFNKTDTNHSHRSKNEIISSYILDNIKKNINNKKYQDKTKNYNNKSKISINFKDEKNKNILNLENLYKNSITALEDLKEQTEKNIFFTKKYSENINNNLIDKDLFPENILMKKKFLINYLLTFSARQ